MNSFHFSFYLFGKHLVNTSLVAQGEKNLPSMQDTQVRSLGWEGPLEKGWATHSSIFSQRIPWIEDPGRLQSMRLQRVLHNWVTNTFISICANIVLGAVDFQLWQYFTCVIWSRWIKNWGYWWKTLAKLIQLCKV